MKPGTVIADKFRVERLLGQGGMGQVVVATHIKLEQTVALKFLHEEILSHPEVVERLLREARASAKLKSEHACRVTDVGQLDNGAPYIVMELLEGEDLATVIHRAPLSPAVAAEYILQAAVAIAEAHGVEIVHRDLKPSNLFVTKRLDDSPLVKVLDFGIAKAATKADAQLTKTTAVMGSPGYMSPEQLRSAKVVDARTDIWALGVILYEAVTGHLPFRGDTLTELAVKVSMDEPEPLDTDPAYAAVVMKCLQKPVEKRYQSIAELAAALAPIAGAKAERSLAMIAGLATKSTSEVTPAPVAPTLAVTEPPITPKTDPEPEKAPAKAVETAKPEAEKPKTDSEPEKAADAKSAPEPEKPKAVEQPAEKLPAVAAKPQAKPNRTWLFGGLGALVLILVIVTITIVSRKDEDPKLAVNGSGSGSNPKSLGGGGNKSPREEALEFLDMVFARANGGKAGTREEALAFLDKAYAQQLAQDDELDPNGVFAPEITEAIKAGQVEGANSATVTVVEAWDFA